MQLTGQRLKIYNMVDVGDTVIIARSLVGSTVTKDEFVSRHDHANKGTKK